MIINIIIIVMITIISSAVPGMLQILPQENILFQLY